MSRVLFSLILAVAATPSLSQDAAKDASPPPNETEAAIIAFKKKQQAECNWQATERRLSGPKRREFLQQCLGDNASVGGSTPKDATKESQRR